MLDLNISHIGCAEFYTLEIRPATADNNVRGSCLGLAKQSLFNVDRRLGGSRQRLIDVPHDVIGRLYTDRDSNEIRRYTRGELFFLGQLSMGG